MDFTPSWQLPAYYPAPAYVPPPPVFIDVCGMPVFMGPYGLVDVFGAPYADPFNTAYVSYEGGYFEGEEYQDPSMYHGY